MMKNVLHLKAPGNWINDPNGFIYYKGKYHLFYQHFPYAPVWGTMHWGHAVSEDLVHWEHQGIALFPTKDYDRNGVFSGSALEVDGKLYLYYSAVKYLETESENIHMAKDGKFETSQAMVVSEDGVHFDNWKAKTQIIPVNHDASQAHDTHTRDPKVWKEGDTYYMALGSTMGEEIGRLVIYTSKDGIHWEFANQLQDRRFGKILECPDIFRVGDDWVFEGSAMYIGDPEEGYESHAICAPAVFEPGKCELSISGECKYMDYGMDLYAPQTNLDKDGRRVMIGWMRMPQAVKEKNGMEWNGMMCQPRVIDVENGHIFFRVHPEVRAYFNQETPIPEKLDYSRPFCLKMNLEEGEILNIGRYRIWMENGAVHTDRSIVFAGMKSCPLIGKSPDVSGRCELEIFVDKNLIEIFINDGEFVISHVVYGLGECMELSCSSGKKILFLRHGGDEEM